MPNPNPTHKWKKGESGNPAGRPRKESTLRYLLETIGDEPQTIVVNGEQTTVSRKEMLARVLWQQSIRYEGEGKKRHMVVDESILKHLLDRLEGKATQPIAGEADAPPLRLVIRQFDDSGDY